MNPTVASASTVAQAFFTVAEVADIARVSDSTIYLDIADGALRARKIRGQWRIDLHALEIYLGIHLGPSEM
jgi:excisionase family DNA binding protein